MKLVDILAKEMKVWPEALGHALGQASDGTLHCDMEPVDAEIVRTRERYTVCTNYIMDCVTRAEWQAAVDSLNAPKVVEWDGEGEPPVGIECEWHPNVHGWVKVKILGRDGSDTWYRASGEEHSQTCRNMAFFRPIRTAKQVAAEEREKAAKELYMTINWDSKPGTWENLLQARRDDYRKAIDAGYRKEPIPCGS